MTSAPSYPTVVLRPRSMQWFVEQFPFIVLAISGIIYGGLDGMPLRHAAIFLSLFISLFLLYQLLYMHKTRYIVTAEQLVCEYGVFQRRTSYMELFRVVDFDEHQTFMQQLTGLKTITVHSMDRTTPHLRLKGINVKTDIVGELRRRVNFNRQYNRIHELANTYF